MRTKSVDKIWLLQTTKTCIIWHIVKKIRNNMERNLADQRFYIEAFKVFLNMIGQYISYLEIVSILVLRNQCFKIEKDADRLYRVIRKEPAYPKAEDLGALYYGIWST